MTIVSTGQLGFDTVDNEIGRGTTTQTDLNFLNGYIVSGSRPSQPNLNSFHGLTYFQNNTQGNCNNGNTSNCNCNCGNIQCNSNANCQNINCTNCDSQAYLQTNCNCACTYNCNSNANCYSYNCNCSKIICTKLYQIGMMPDTVFAADQHFGEILKQHNPETYEGYVRWAEVVVDWMSGEGPTVMYWIRDKDKRAKAQSDLATRWAYKIATPWSEHMAYLIGTRKKDNEVGRAIMTIGAPISRIVKSMPKGYTLGFVGGCVLALIFFSTYYAAHALAWCRQTFFNKELEHVRTEQR